MKQTRWPDRSCSVLIALYPKALEREYGSEMRAVFRQASRAAVQEGAGSLFRLILRELIDLP